MRKVIIITMIILSVLIPVNTQIIVTNQGLRTTSPPVLSSTLNSTVTIAMHNLNLGGPNKEWMPFFEDMNANLLFITETGLWSPEDGTLNAAVKEINAMFPSEIPYQGVATVPEWRGSGNSLLSRYPIKSYDDLNVLYYPDGSIYNINHSVLHAVVEIAGIDVHIFIVHLTCCTGSEPNRVLEQELILDYMDSLGDVPIIYAGDFNSDSPLDNFTNLVNTQTLGVEPIEMLLNSSHPKSSQIHKFIDVQKTLNPFGNELTFDDKQFQSRLDYIFVNQHLFETPATFKVHHEYEEINNQWDHWPVSAVLNFDYNNTDLRPPIPVHGLEADVSSTMVNITWLPNEESDLAGYKVYRDGVLKANNDINITHFNDSSVQENTVYEYLIRAIDNSSNESPEYNQIYVNPSIGLLDAPNITAVSVDTSIPKRVNLKADVIDGGLPVQEFRFYRAVSENEVYRLMEINNNGEFTDTINRKGITVFYKVQAINEIGRSFPYKVSATVTGESLTSITEKESDFSTIIGLFSFITLTYLRKWKRIRL